MEYVDESVTCSVKNQNVYKNLKRKRKLES